MAKDKTLELSIQIAGKVDKSLMSAIGQAQRSVSGFSKSISKVGTAGLAAMGAMATGTVAAIVSATNAAKDFEAQMGDVVKYVNGLADATGKISDKIDAETGRTFADNYGRMKDAILDLSTQIPMTAEDLTRLAAAAGQSGKAIDDLIQYDKNGNIQGFLKDVAMMGTAMDIDADQAGNWAAKWEKSFNMTHAEVMELADQINYLGANSATTAAEIGEVVNRSASVGQIAGVKVSTTAALADAMLATGVESERAGTALKNLYTRMSLGESSTKRQKEMWEELGFTASGIAKSMQTDSVGTTLDVFNAINQLPDDRRLAAIKDLFGMWTTEGAAKIANNLDVYTDALAMVSDPSLYKGSMEREFIIKASTSESIDQMMANSWQALKIDFGDEFLPVKKQFSLLMIDVMNDIRKNMPELKQLGESLADIASKGVDKLGTALETALPYIQRGLDYVANNGEKVATVIGGLAATFAGMKAAPIIDLLFGGGGNLLFGKAGAFGKKKGGLSSLWNKGQKAYGKAQTVFDGAKMGMELAGSAAMTNGMYGTPAMLGQASAGGGFFSKLTNKGIGAYYGAKAAKGLQATNDKTFWSNFLALQQNITNTQNRGLIGEAGIALQSAKVGLGEKFSNSFTGNLFGSLKQGGGGVLSSVGGMISNANNPARMGIGMLGADLMSGLGGIGSSLLGAGTSFLAPVAGMFGSILAGALPIVAVISSIIAVVSILYDNLDGVRNIVGQVFGEQGLAVFDSFKSGLDSIIATISDILNGGLADALAPVKEKVVGFFSDMFGPDVGQMVSTTFDSVTMIVQSVLGVVGQLVTFATTYVKPIIEEIFNFLVTTVLPVILQTFNAAAPTISSIITNIGTAVMTVAQIIAQAIQYALPIIEGIITVVLGIGSVVIPAVLAAVNVAWQTISSVVTSIQGVFNGLITFITGVFTGNWSQAWEGVKQVFGNAFNALVDLCKAPINAVIALINKAISGINGLGLTIPDWVPGIGGKAFSINIPTIPQLAKGGFTDGPSIAGEAGREAVISFDSSARAANIATWAKAGQLLGVDNKQELKSFDAGSRSGGNITFAPQITINGNADQSVVDNMVDQMRTMFEQWYEQKERMKYRTAY